MVYNHIYIYMVYNHKGNNSTRRYNYYKYLCTHQWSLQIHKATNNKHKGSNQYGYKIIWDFNSLLTLMERSFKEKINEETMALNHTFDQMYLIGIFRIFHPKIVQYTFFSSTHQIFSSIYHALDHKTSLHKLKRTEIIPCIFSDHSAMNLEINCKKNSGKHTHTAWLNNIQLNKERSTKKSKRKF